MTEGCTPQAHGHLEIPPPREASIVSISARTAVILMFFCIAFTALMASTYMATKPAIEASALLERLQMIDAVLPRDNYDNDLLADFVVLPPVKELGLSDETRLYRARKAGKPVALVLEAAAPDGYAGRIGLMLALRAGGELAAVRVTDYKETPGLGDYIDPKKDRNKSRPWITQFTELGTDKLPLAEWKVKKDGGRIDQMAGATISARAVTNATRRAVEWALAHRDALFALEAQSSYKE